MQGTEVVGEERTDSIDKERQVVGTDGQQVLASLPPYTQIQNEGLFPTFINGGGKTLPWLQVNMVIAFSSCWLRIYSRA